MAEGVVVPHACHLFQWALEVLPLETPELENGRVIEEAYRLAEQNLQSQLDIALAADQRSVSFCGLVIAAVAAIIGLTDNNNLSWILGLSTLLLTSSAIMSALSFRPASFYVRGLPFENFKSDISDNKNYTEVISELASIYDDLISKNNKTIARNAKFFRFSLYLALLGLVLITVPVIYSSFTNNSDVAVPEPTAAELQNFPVIVA